jgi:hypothetical protein
MVNKQIGLIACALLVLLALSFSINALGITSVYYAGNPLTLQPGQTKTVSLGLSNNAGEQENLTVIANITKGGEIAQLVDKDKQYTLPFGTNNNVGINVLISAPAGDPVGKQYNIEVTVSTITPGGSAVVLGSSIGTSIPVTIVSSTGEIPKKTPLSIQWIVLIILILIILLIIIIAILSKKKKKK